MRRFLAALVLVALLGAAGCAQAPADDGGRLGATARPDPASDRLGWERGHWHNDTLRIDQGDGLNETERQALVGRAMARVEYIRRIEFDSRVQIDVISRAAYRNRSSGGDGPSAALRTFDNAKFEAMFLIGEDAGSIEIQEATRGSSVLGFYSPSKDRIVVVSSSATPTMSELTLAHELVHALQFRTFDPSFNRSTRELNNARLGLVEGDARYVDLQYRDRCGDTWSCVVPSASGGGAGTSFHYGVYALNYFPYSDGPGFVNYFRKRGGWERVNDLYDDPPASTAQVITPATYGQGDPAEVRLRDRNRSGWHRVRPPGRIDYAALGQSGVATMFAYTLFDDDPKSVIARTAFINIAGAGVDTSDPFNYNVSYANGWEGDRMHVYRKGDQTGYVWRIHWTSPAEASEFAAGYRDLLRYRGARRVEDGVWRIDSGPFADAFEVRVSGATVTVVNAPTVDDLSAVHAG